MYNFMLAGLDATSWVTIIMLVVCVVAFSFFLIRPQQKQQNWESLRIKWQNIMNA